MNAADELRNPTPEDELTRRAPSRHGSTLSVGLAVTLAVVLLLVGFGGGYLIGKSTGTTANGTGGSVTITETGSTLIAPVMSLWGPNFTALHPNVAVTVGFTGSGTGISSAESGTVDIGGTDAYLAPASAAQYNLINVPVAISAQLIFYNLPGLNQVHLNLNGTIVAMIYAGVITTWNNPLIQAANPGVKLPAQTIIPLHRSDGSGDTFMFSSFCYLSWKGWPNGYGTTVQWLASSPGYNGNGGMVSGLHNTQYGIAYIGISYETEALGYGLGFAALGDNLANANGTDPANYILPSATNISEDANLGLRNLAPPSMAVSLILGGVPGATNLQLGHGGTNPTPSDPTPYPIVNLEYLLISTHPADPSHQLYVVQFIQWILSYGNEPGRELSAVSFLPLTPAVIGYDMQALQQVPVSS
jgi:phosphate transport system substrate-binding protein